jgi:hypothetical protein
MMSVRAPAARTVFEMLTEALRCPAAAGNSPRR